MADDTDRSNNALRYDRMVEDALLSVVHRSLSYAAENGLPGEHHFYITFRTDHPDVDIPNHLRERYPGEMTIILQFQFWDLEVRDESFSVTLSFSDVPEKLTIPFDAVAAFADPSVRFGLQFDVGESATDDNADGEGSEPAASLPAPSEDEAPGETESPTPQVTTRSKKAPKADKKTLEESGDQDSNGDAGEDDSDNVVTLDTFRKK